MVKKIAGTISAAKIGQALLNIGKDAIQAASDLQEVQNVVDVTFGSNANKIEAWAKKAGTQFGLTETQAKRFTSTLGAMMKSAGMSGDEITDMSTDLAGLAADMASFYNLDFDTAFQKIRSGISGETEPLKQLGINMSVANLEAFALQQGLSKTFDEMTQGEQTMLRYQYLMSATADAQGDFARTSDGYANSMRSLETNIESLKTKLGEVLLPAVSEAVEALNGFISILFPDESKKTVLDDFNDIEIDTKQKMADLNETYGKASDIIKLLNDISKTTVTLNSGETKTLEELFGDMAKVEQDGGNVREYLEGLGVDVDFVSQKYDVWKGYIKELTQLVPELSESIDGQTGSINGGTEALQKNLDEWKAVQEKKIAWSEYYAKEQALAEKRGSMFSYEMDVGSAQAALERQREWLDTTGKRSYIPEDDTYGRVTHSGMFDQYSEEEKAWNDAVTEYERLRDKVEDAKEEYARQTTDYTEAEQQLADAKQYLIDKYGEEEKAITETTEATTAQIAAATEAEKTFNEALDAVNKYRQGVWDSTKSQVDSTVSGFSKMTTAAEQYADAANEAQSLWDELTKENKYTEAEIKVKVDAANAQVTLEKMTEGLQSQLEYIKEYQENLKTAQEAGVSGELLASLSDGSNESALYLNAIAEAAKAGDTASIEQLNDLWKEVNEGKETFTDTLTNQKLAVDENYDAMVAKAQEAAQNLDVSEMISTSTGNNISAIATAISEKIPEVASQVNAVLAELNRLNDWGVTIDYGFGASTQINAGVATKSGNGTITPLAVGMDWIPFDGFLAQLHEGEAVLTAEENRIWQQFKNGNGVDYDTLGGVMRDNVKAGGNVYLDGRQVGSVVSQIQGNQYRTLQRSGWQA